MLKFFVQKRLEGYVRRYFAAHPDIKLVVVAGSVGKTSTKTAIATVLSQGFRVRLHEGNHNTHVSAPLAILGIDYPARIRSVGAWLSVFRAARERIRQPKDVDVIVQELGVDHPGDMAAFARYIRPSVAVVTAVSAEHLEYFGSVQAIAQEELQAANIAEFALINRDDIDGTHATYLTNSNVSTYGTDSVAENYFDIKSFTVEEGYKGELFTSGIAESITTTIKVVGRHNLRPAVAAGAVAVHLSLPREKIAQGLKLIRPVPGRMNMLRGTFDSLIIDDTYNSSPLAASAALETLYQLEAPQKIAILGSMNELGAVSAEEHKKLGELCDANELSWVITVGKEAEAYLAPAARAKGCQVKSFQSAIKAGAFAREVLQPKALVLAKGSQGDIYLEETVKMLLHATEEDHQLVRQSPEWIRRKQAYFEQFS